ncbi:MAG: cell division protein ZapA, partial [Pseudomonadota bacterium]
MAQVRITLNQRTYRLDCEEPARPRFDEIAKIVQQKAASVIEEFGNIGQDQVLLMSALKIADELVDARAQNADGGANVDAAANAGADTVA